MRFPRRTIGPRKVSVMIVSVAIAGILWHTRVRVHDVPGRDGPEVPHPSDGRVRPDDAFSGRRTPVAFEGVVLERMKSDGFWCGAMSSYQGVRYRVTRPLEGGVAHRELVVFHSLVGPPLCEADQPQLSRAIFRTGARLRIRAERTEKGALVSWEAPSNATVLAEP